MSSPRNIHVYTLGPPQAPAPVEMCEHKGIGHPDTLTDAVCEAVGLELVRRYREQFRGAMHFNVDKGLLVGGRSAPRFGGGEVLERPKLIVCGRAANPGGRLDLAGIVTGAAAAWLDANLTAGSALFQLGSEVGEGSASLARVFAAARVRANDTSFGVGYAPLSTLEAKVATLAQALASRALRARIPAAGEDFKIMGLRDGHRFTFTVAVALVDRQVTDLAAYFDAKVRLREALCATLEAGDEVIVNRLDAGDARDERDVYLTVTGLSAEMGDDGQVGRGNRVNGLISPGRAMSLEAAAGKNPYAHVGKIYNVLAHRLARRVVEEMPQAGSVTVRLLSAIGEPLDRPQAAAVELTGQVGAAARARVRALVEHEFDALESFLAELADGRHRVY